MDEEILSILGIDSVEDLTQEEYLSLLKEASVRAQMKGSAISSNALIRITEEIKRVRRESTTATAKGVSQEEVRKRKVDPQKVFAAKSRPVQKPVGQKLLTASKEKEAEDQKETRALTRVIPSALNTLTAGVNNIVQVMVKDLTMEKKQSEAERKAAENLGREEREEDSEKKVADKSQNFFKGFKPPKLGIFDKLKNFFTMVALGGLFTWLSKPENQDKIKKFTDFIEDHGSKILLGIAGLLALGIGAQILSFVGSLISVGGVLLGILLNPLFLKTLLALAAAAGAMALITKGAKKVRSTASNIIYGSGKTKEGTTFSQQDVVDYANEQKDAMNMAGQKPEVISKVMEPFNKLTDKMKEHKQVNDMLYTMREGDLFGRKGSPEDIKKLEEKKAKLQAEVTELAAKAGLTDYSIMQIQMRYGRRKKDETYVPREGESLLDKAGNLIQNLGDAKKALSGEDKEPELTDQQKLDQYLASKDGQNWKEFDSKHLQWNSQLEIPEIKPEASERYYDKDGNKRATPLTDQQLQQMREQKRKAQQEAAAQLFGAPVKRSGRDAPVLPEGVDAANKAYLDSLQKGSAHPKTKAILEDLIKNGAIEKPVEVSVVPVTPPTGPGPGASSNGHQLGLPKFPTTDQSNMSVAAVAGVYNSPIPRA